ncbi:hypothetical protein OPW32_19615 [Vibrio europaeus]|uniref:hypothetical protein n=1 Tax=Vibrio europaeus TaxID=300876 RepID=UPI0023404222|nr:hypothetical protein [Vibrio europaeus]MDC5851397.1 hypothetical protein [Vibrio europaeus]
MSDIKQKLSVSVFESLLKPSTDYLGVEIKEYFQKRIEGAKKKKEQQNLLSHIESVRQKSSSKQQQPLSYTQLDLFEQWAVEVEKVDPSNETLSDIWHNLLLNSEDSFNSEILLTKLKKLSPGDARTLIKVLNRSSLSREDRYRLQSLKNLELVEHNEFKVTSIKLVFLVIGFLGVASTSILVLSPSEIQENFSKPLSNVMSIAPLLFSSVLLFSFFKYLDSGKSKLLSIWQLTWLGERLVSLSEPNSDFQYPIH